MREMLKMFPKMIKVRQVFEQPKIIDFEKKIREELERKHQENQKRKD